MVIRFQEKSNFTWRFAFFSINWSKPRILPNTHKSATFSPLKEKECSSSPLRAQQNACVRAQDPRLISPRFPDSPLHGRAQPLGTLYRAGQSILTLPWRNDRDLPAFCQSPSQGLLTGALR